MTTTIVQYPLQEMPIKAKEAFLYRDRRSNAKIKGRTVRLKYPYGTKTARVTFAESGTVLKVEASLFRAISGQNAITMPDLPKAVMLTFQFVTLRLDEEFHCGFLKLDDSRDIKLSMVDLVRHYRIGTRQDVNMLLDAIQKQIRLRSNLVSKPVFRGRSCETVEVELPKLEMKVKFYDKCSELEKPGHRIPQAIPDKEDLLRFTKGCVRMEVTLRLNALKNRGLVKLKNWNAKARNDVFSDVLGSLNLRGKFKVSINDDVFKKLPQRLRLLYLRWRLGHEIKDIPRSTLARQKKELMEAFGVDIECDPRHQKATMMSIRDAFGKDRTVRPTKKEIEKWLPLWKVQGAT